MKSWKYGQWNEKCWVRSGAQLVHTPSTGMPDDAFPRGLLPYASRLASEYGESSLKTALTQACFGYLRFTEMLELKSINQVGNRIALGELSVPVSRDLKSRAFLLVRDEAHHATVSDDVSEQLEELTGVSPLNVALPQFLSDLQMLSDASRPDVAMHLETAFATISETLISGSLALIPQDTAVLPLIRDFAAAHMVDEGRHASYFSEFFAQWWPQLPKHVREGLGARLPQLCLAFLRPDLKLHQSVLQSVGLSESRARDWVTESFPASSLGPSSRKPLQVTLSLFARLGVFDQAATYDAFASCGLID